MEENFTALRKYNFWEGNVPELGSILPGKPIIVYTSFQIHGLCCFGYTTANIVIFLQKMTAINANIFQNKTAYPNQITMNKCSCRINKRGQTMPPE